MPQSPMSFAHWPKERWDLIRQKTTTLGRRKREAAGKTYKGLKTADPALSAAYGCLPLQALHSISTVTQELAGSHHCSPIYYKPTLFSLPPTWLLRVQPVQ